MIIESGNDPIVFMNIGFPPNCLSFALASVIGQKLFPRIRNASSITRVHTQTTVTSQESWGRQELSVLPIR